MTKDQLKAALLGGGPFNFEGACRMAPDMDKRDIVEAVKGAIREGNCYLDLAGAVPLFKRSQVLPFSARKIGAGTVA